MSLLRILLLPLLAVIAGCGANPAIQSDNAPSVDFSRYRTYSWAASEDPAVNVAPPGIVVQIEATAETRFAAVGLREVASNPDLLVSYRLIVNEEVNINEYEFEPTWQPAAVTVARQENGTIVIDLIDADNQQLVWRGRAARVFTDPYEVEPEEIRDAVEQILDQYPPE